MGRQQKHKCLTLPVTVLQSMLSEYTDCNMENFNRKGPELLKENHKKTYSMCAWQGLIIYCMCDTLIKKKNMQECISVTLKYTVMECNDNFWNTVQ